MSPDLTLSFLGNETGLISSFLSSEELGELLDKVHILNWPLFKFFSVLLLQLHVSLSSWGENTVACWEGQRYYPLQMYAENWLYVGVIKCTPILIRITNKVVLLRHFYFFFFLLTETSLKLASRNNHEKLNQGSKVPP